MFNFLKNKQLTTKLVAPVKGKLIPITSVKDDVFSQKMVGDGFAVIPTSDEVAAPASGIISSIFPTKHALGITTASGLEIMLHLGLDTVELNGSPFNITATAGQKVHAGDSLGTMSIKNILDNQFDPTVMVVVTNMDRVAAIPIVTAENVDAGESVMDVETKPKD